MSKQAATVANRGHRFAEAISLVDHGLEWAPLDWQLYFLRAVARIGARESPARALDDFRRARFLEPDAYQLPFEEGKAWLGWQPTLAITAWREALQRRGAEEAGIYALMLTDAANYDAKVHAALREFAINRPGLTINYLEAATSGNSRRHCMICSQPTPNSWNFPRSKRHGFSNCGRSTIRSMNCCALCRPIRNGWNLPGRESLVTMPVATSLRRLGSSLGACAPPSLPKETRAGESISAAEEGALRQSWRFRGRLRALSRTNRLRQDRRRARHGPAFHLSTGCAGLFSLPGSASLGREGKTGNAPGDPGRITNWQARIRRRRRLLESENRCPQ